MPTPDSLERRHLVASAKIAGALCLLLALVHLVPFSGCYGVRPRELGGLPGVVTAVFLHGDWEHLLSNVGALFLLLAGVLWYFPRRALAVSAGGTLLTNLAVWAAGHPGCHIGASSLVYVLAAYLVAMSVFARQRELGAFVLIVAFLYGGMVWGVLPTKEGVSWESHLFGAVWGALAAVAFRRDPTWPQLLARQMEEQRRAMMAAGPPTVSVQGRPAPQFDSTRIGGNQAVDNWTNFATIDYTTPYGHAAGQPPSDGDDSHTGGEES